MTTDLEMLKTVLKESVCTVKFTKLDETVRDMVCTQNLELIPVDKYQKQSALPTPKSDSATRVFDLEKQEWRSFRNDSLISWSL